MNGASITVSAGPGPSGIAGHGHQSDGLVHADPPQNIKKKHKNKGKKKKKNKKKPTKTITHTNETNNTPKKKT